MKGNNLKEAAYRGRESMLRYYNNTHPFPVFAIQKSYSIQCESQFLTLLSKAAANRDLMRAFGKFYNIEDDCDAPPYSVHIKPS